MTCSDLENVLGIVIDRKFKVSEHISYVVERCKKVIHSLSKSVKISWGLQPEALQSMYKGAVLYLLLYGAPVLIEAVQYEHISQKYSRVQRLMNIKMAKAYRKTSSEALCILTGMTSIIIKSEEWVIQHNIRNGMGSQAQLVDSEV